MNQFISVGIVSAALLSTGITAATARDSDGIVHLRGAVVNSSCVVTGVSEAIVFPATQSTVPLTVSLVACRPDIRQLADIRSEGEATLSEQLSASDKGPALSKNTATTQRYLVHLSDTSRDGSIPLSFIIHYQ